MVVDLDRCTGCEACVVACHAENNIPTVGDAEAARGRAMHWLRVERYWEGEFPDVRLKFRPVLCQQCDAAPCEPVCPTYASHHTEEGLNAQVYNRCIGTRYCANACSYNVRFFNFFNPIWEKPLHLQLNPDVSVREVGVMEKCTFCVQRIKATTQLAKSENREMKDGELKPACAQSCPATAIVFGDMNDPESQVSRLSRSGRARAARGSRHPAQHLSQVAGVGMTGAAPAIDQAKMTEDLLRPLLTTTWRFWALVIILGGIVMLGVGSFAYQVDRGIGVWGLNWPVFWAFDITNFVFWIGISHAGTLISAILRLVNAGWRRPVTRCAEVITAFALMIGAMFPIVHLGRPWLFFWLMPYPSERQIWPNFRSPLVWDFFAISTYLTGSLLFLYLPTIPDFALVRDRTTGWRHKFYGALALGWRGTTRQWHRLESAMQIMAIAIIPVAVSVHTIVSFDFSMAIVPMWHSTIFGPYFVAGAIFSGIAALIIAMAALRKFLHLEAYLHPVHFENLGKLLLMMSLLWGYFVFAERLTTWYGNESSEMSVFWATQRGAFAPLYWTMVVCNFVSPLCILSFRKLRTVTGCVIASCGVVVGMWLERFLIIVPTLSHKYLSYSWGSYRPRMPEILLLVATFGAMGLLYVLFSKLVPIISIWELKVGEQPVVADPEETRDEAQTLWRTHP
jgi:molybdopterin-containing oxidoreductase family membrane subunit